MHNLPGFLPEPFVLFILPEWKGGGAIIFKRKKFLLCTTRGKVLSLGTQDAVV